MAKPIEQVIGDNVKRLREGLGISQAELGEEVGVRLGTKWIPQTVSAAERGKRQFIAAEIVVLAHVLKCRIQYLFESPDSEPIMISDAFISTPDFTSTLDASGINDEQLRRMYSKLRTNLQAMPAIAGALKEDLKKIEDIAANTTRLLRLEQGADEDESADA